MAFFYDSDEERDHASLPIILEPDNESNANPLRKHSPELRSFHNGPSYDGASYKGDSDDDFEEDEISELNASNYDDKFPLPQLTNSTFGGSNVFQLTKRSDDNMRFKISRENDDTMKEVQFEAPALTPSPKPAQVHVPTHPIPSMQDAFAESMTEVSGAPGEPKPNIGTASSRRKRLLDQDVDVETHAARWRQKPGQQYHELWKLMAQISFGIYLLLNGIARDDDQVMNILQGHVDEVDGFLETTLEDFDLAQEDIQERLKLLKMPLENIKIFDAMLEDRNFRVQIVNGNERIEHVITRTAKAMNDALRDVSQGLNACKEFTIYLAKEQESAVWKRERPHMQKVFEAMKGNVEGWHKAYVSLQTRGNNLGVALVQLGTIVAEMDRRAGDISRKYRFSQSSSPASPPPLSPRQSKQMRQSMLRDLPTDPSPITPAIRAALPAFGMVDDRERTPETEQRQEQLQELDSQSSVPTEGSSISELAAPEPEFILKPHVYSPVSSPKVPSSAKVPAPVTQKPPQSPKSFKSRTSLSLRKRFSLKRKPSEITITAQPPPQRQPPQPPQPVRAPPQRPPPPVQSEQLRNHSPRPIQQSDQQLRNRSPRPTPQSDQQSQIHSPRPTQQKDQRSQNYSPRPDPGLRSYSERGPYTDQHLSPRSVRQSPSVHSFNGQGLHEREAPLNTPPSRGLDSAYCSDFEKQSPPGYTRSGLVQTPTSLNSPRIINLPPRNEGREGRENSNLTRDYLPSPRSDQQFFRPVLASPNSPLQRPWTAAPANMMHMHSNSSSSNLRFGSTPTPSNIGNRRGAPSAMNMSVMTGMTDMTMMTEGGKKVKKKRSAFGWLKKQFSLSEEEKAAFEERRRGVGTVQEERGGEQRWLDGRRIR